MSKLPIISSEKLVKILQKLGFNIVRQKGSHVFLKNKDGRITIVPLHKGQDIDRGLFIKMGNYSYEYAKRRGIMIEKTQEFAENNQKILTNNEETAEQIMARLNKSLNKSLKKYKN